MMRNLLELPAVVDLAGDTFRPDPRRIQRVTFAWLDGGSLRGTLVSDDRAATVVVLWPTDVLGRLQAGRLEEALVMEWRMKRQELATLRKWAGDWPVDRHDYLVGAGLFPCAGTLGASKSWRKVEQQVARRVEVLERWNVDDS
jgi:hypothetical protein